MTSGGDRIQPQPLQRRAAQQPEPPRVVRVVAVGVAVHAFAVERRRVVDEPQAVAVASRRRGRGAPASTLAARGSGIERYVATAPIRNRDGPVARQVHVDGPVEPRAPPTWPSARASASTTSARPPVFAHGSHSAAMKAMRIATTRSMGDHGLESCTIGMVWGPGSDLPRLVSAGTTIAGHPLLNRFTQSAGGRYDPADGAHRPHPLGRASARPRPARARGAAAPRLQPVLDLAPQGARPVRAHQAAPPGRAATTRSRSCRHGRLGRRCSTTPTSWPRPTGSSASSTATWPTAPTTGSTASTATSSTARSPTSAPSTACTSRWASTRAASASSPATT